MKKNLVLLFLVFIHFEGISQNWVKITYTNVGDTIYMNDNYVKKGGVLGTEKGVVRVWTKTIVNKYEDVTTGRTKIYRNAVLKTLIEYDCINQKSRSITNILYDSDGNTLLNGENNEYANNWNYIVPESVGEEMLSFACKLLLKN